MNARKLIADFFSRNKALVLVTFVASIGNSLLNVLLPLSIGKFYELAFHESSAKGKLFDTLHLSVNTMSGFFLFFLVLIILKSVITYGEKYFTGLVGERFSRNLRELLFRTQLSHSMPVHELKPAGKYLLRYSGDLSFIQRFISKGIIQFSGDLVFLTAAFTVLLLINTTLTAVVIAGLAAAAGIIVLLNKSVRKATISRRNQRSALLGFVTTRLQAFYTLKSFNREVPETTQFNRQSRKMYELGINYYRVYALVQAILPALFFGTMALVLYFVAVERETNPAAFHHGDVLNYILLLLYIQSSIRRMLGVNVVWQLGQVSMLKLLRIINQPVERRDDPATMVPAKGKIVFEDVSFQYEHAQQPAVEHLTCCFEPGTITWLQGRQGSGKSTVLKLIQGIYTPGSGKIFLDDQPFASLAPNAVRKNVAIISDEAPLIGNTVFKAISYNTADEKREKTAQLLERLGFHVGGSSNQSLDYRLSDYAKNLSNGQRKLLMFARAFLTRKKVLLIDEVFDDLDPDARAKVLAELQRLASKRTIIIAGSRLPETLKAGQIINLNELHHKIQRSYHDIN
ncbi:MAG: ABC transporter ATP-binding protein/permease [Chitinophagales bacterium]|nr:ABC transporter ATP-binding protein/permease [Chitinophagales bacterium]